MVSLMSTVQLFQHPQLGTLTTYTDENGNEYFKAHDICVVLSLTNPSSQLKRNVKDKWIFEFDDGYSKSGKALYVSEPGLYALVFRSKTPKAEAFQDWVFEEVLPKLRSNGYYVTQSITSEQIEALQAELDAIRWELEGERQEREHLEMVNDDLKHTNRLLGNQDKLKKQVFEYLKLHIIHKPGKYADSGEVLHNFNRKYKLDVEETIFDTWADEFFKIFYSKETDAPYVNREDIAHFYENCVVLTKCNRINQYRLG